MNTQSARTFLTTSETQIGGTGMSSAAMTSLLGTWKNINSSSRDIVKLLIAGSGSCIAVDAFGASTPTPCEWGSVLGIAYASGAGQGLAFTAQYILSSSHVILIGRLRGKELRVECFTQFFDGSGRPNLYSADTLIQ